MIVPVVTSETGCPLSARTARTTRVAEVVLPTSSEAVEEVTLTLIPTAAGLGFAGGAVGDFALSALQPKGERQPQGQKWKAESVDSSHSHSLLANQGVTSSVKKPG